MNSPHRFSIVPAERKHVPAIHAMIRELAQYENALATMKASRLIDAGL
jgi:hypothetical protein